MMRTKGIVQGLSVLSAVILTVSVIAFSFHEKNQREFGLGYYGNTDIALLERSFEQNREPGELVELLKALCYQALVLDMETPELKAKIKHYGNLLLDKARAQEIDLSTLDNEDTMLELLEYIRSFGAR